LRGPGAQSRRHGGGKFGDVAGDQRVGGGEHDVVAGGMSGERSPIGPVATGAVVQVDGKRRFEPGQLPRCCAPLTVDASTTRRRPVKRCDAKGHVQ